MSSYIRFFLVFFAAYFAFVALHAAFSEQLTLYAIRSCEPEPHILCYVFDLIHKWFFLAVPAVCAILAFVITLATKRSAA
jgi:hypothetical protein